MPIDTPAISSKSSRAKARRAHAVIKVDDTDVGIDEGREAGCRTVGVCLSGNEAGVRLDEFARKGGVRQAGPA